MYENGSSYGKWTLSKLKTELRKRDAKVAGRKRELVERLFILMILFNFFHLQKFCRRC